MRERSRPATSEGVSSSATRMVPSGASRRAWPTPARSASTRVPTSRRSAARSRMTGLSSAASRAVWRTQASRQAKAALRPSSRSASVALASTGSSRSAICTSRSWARTGSPMCCLSASMRRAASQMAAARCARSISSPWPSGATSMAAWRCCSTRPTARPGEAGTPARLSGPPPPGAPRRTPPAPSSASPATSPQRSATARTRASTARAASAPEASNWIRSPGPMESPRMETTDRASTRSTPRRSEIVASKRRTSAASSAAGRACRPWVLVTVTGAERTSAPCAAATGGAASAWCWKSAVRPATASARSGASAESRPPLVTSTTVRRLRACRARASRSSCSTGWPRPTRSPSRATGVKPAPPRVTVSSPTWTSTSTPAAVVMAKAWWAAWNWVIDAGDRRQHLAGGRVDGQAVADHPAGEDRVRDRVERDHHAGERRDHVQDRGCRHGSLASKRAGARTTRRQGRILSQPPRALAGARAFTAERAPCRDRGFPAWRACSGRGVSPRPHRTRLVVGQVAAVAERVGRAPSCRPAGPRTAPRRPRRRRGSPWGAAPGRRSSRPWGSC